MKQLHYQIDKKICTVCKICVNECPTGSIKENNGTLEIKKRNCIQCGHCAAVCPEGAVTCDGESLPQYSIPSLKEDDIFRFITGKRSVRHYKKKSIPQESLDKILKVGSLTATASNTQDVRASVFRGDEVSDLSKTLSSELMGFLKKFNNPVGRLLARMSGFKAYASKTGLNIFLFRLNEGVLGKKDPLFFNAPAVIHLSYPKKNKRFGRTNSVLAGENMMLYAHALGIESCMIGFAEMTAKRKNGRLALRTGRGRETGLIFTLGYGTPQYLRLPKRLPLYYER